MWHVTRATWHVGGVNIPSKFQLPSIYCLWFMILWRLEDTARYMGLLQAPAEGFGRGFLLIMLFWPIFGNFWCPVVTLVTFSSNLSNFETNSKKLKKIPKKSKSKKKNSFKNPKINLKKIKKKVSKWSKIQKSLEQKNPFFPLFLCWKKASS